MKFSIKDLTADLVTFTEEILNGKLHSLPSESRNFKDSLKQICKTLLIFSTIFHGKPYIANDITTKFIRVKNKCNKFNKFEKCNKSPKLLAKKSEQFFRIKPSPGMLTEF